MKTEVKTPTKKLSKEEKQKQDIQRANVLLNTYLSIEKEAVQMLTAHIAEIYPFKQEFDNRIKDITARHAEQIGPLEASMTAAKKELLEIGDRNKNLFDAKSRNWWLDESNYLHLKAQSEVVLGSKFSIAKFMKKYSHLVTLNFAIDPLKALFADNKELKKIAKHDISVKVNESAELKRKAVKKVG